MIEGGNGGKARALGDDEAQEQLALGIQHVPLEKLKKHIDDLARRVLCPRRVAYAFHDRANGTTHELLKQCLLVLEVEIKRALGDAGLGGNVVEARGLKPTRGKDRERSIEDGLAPRLRLGSGATRARRRWRRPSALEPAQPVALRRGPPLAAARPGRLARLTRHAPDLL